MRAALLFAAALAPFPALAAPRQIERVAKSDPNRVVCKTEEVLGTRLRRQERCLTAQEWFDLYLDDRRTIERVQGGGWKSN